jgi:hypothetical protein
LSAGASALYFERSVVRSMVPRYTGTLTKTISYCLTGP